ncbi:MgtC/SapB family protein [Lederbergia galactosidilytica]|uniref:Membrane protein n=1 Tax=Lederbergia galactosidilytica TaxID=217031 RepID=A0A0Q9YCF4_9BACI|nr:MgtC/SapB family protein [Lederbergia galactosidilytica]KRG13833.1 membrane protein [Virgibacillus soli]KRG14113.1 membrane protein [Lederbergia galactosidilytica]MBP1914126.1 putative membrane protein YhiD involved in acid resistance [Lederbergia galactosidilytica]OAK67410.1 membrane protein [Lederbergia galactosidilytica]
MSFLYYLFDEYIQGHQEMFIRVIISGVLGFLIGLDRSFKSKPAGIKTYTYVCVACTLITIISIQSAEMLSQENSGKMMDPMRLAAQIVSGLGFLGAGMILKDGLKVIGLTSAAMILFAGGVGIGIGAGFYAIVICAVVVSFLITNVGLLLEKNKLESHKEVEIDIES